MFDGPNTTVVLQLPATVQRGSPQASKLLGGPNHMQDLGQECVPATVTSWRSKTKVGGTQQSNAYIMQLTPQRSTEMDIEDSGRGVERTQVHAGGS